MEEIYSPDREIQSIHCTVVFKVFQKLAGQALQSHL